MGDWKADETVYVKNGCASYCTAHFWIVPAKVEGSWQSRRGRAGVEANLPDDFRHARRGGNTVQIANGKLKGDQITFNAGGSLYTGRVNGSSMEGTTSSGGNWNASRSGKIDIV